MTPSRTSLVWLGMGIIGIAIGIASVVLTTWLRLDPCHLCIFQRLLMLLYGTLALATAFVVWRGSRALIPGTLVALTSLTGVATATHHSWIQAHPADGASCIGGTSGPIESLIEWLGEHMPSLFLATGFCEDTSFQLFGLTLANLSLLSFAALTAVTLWALRR